MKPNAWRIAMKYVYFALLIISVPVFGTVSSRAMCVYSEGPERVNPGNGDTLDSLYVSFDPGFFHHQYSWQMSIGSSLDYHCVTAEGGRACVSLTLNQAIGGGTNCCIVEAHGCVFVNKDFPVDCRDPGEPFGGFKNCPSIECITHEECN